MKSSETNSFTLQNYVRIVIGFQAEFFDQEKKIRKKKKKRETIIKMNRNKENNIKKFTRHHPNQFEEFISIWPCRSKTAPYLRIYQESGDI